MLFGFPAPIIFALALNEVVNRSYKRAADGELPAPLYRHAGGGGHAVPDSFPVHRVRERGAGLVPHQADLLHDQPALVPAHLHDLRHLAECWLGGDHLLGAALTRRSRAVRGGDRGRRLAAAQDVAHQAAGAGAGGLDPADPAHRRAAFGRRREGDPDVQRTHLRDRRRDRVLRVPARPATGRLQLRHRRGSVQLGGQRTR